MEYLHSRSAISIENMTDENDELSVTPRTNEETSTSSKTQVIDFFRLFILFFFYQKLLINSNALEHIHLSIYLSFCPVLLVVCSISVVQKIVLIFYVNHMSFFLSLCRYLIIIKTFFSI
jgi:hypothetical protein